MIEATQGTGGVGAPPAVFNVAMLAKRWQCSPDTVYALNERQSITQPPSRDATMIDDAALIRLERLCC